MLYDAKLKNLSICTQHNNNGLLSVTFCRKYTVIFQYKNDYNKHTYINLSSTFPRMSFYKLTASLQIKDGCFTETPVSKPRKTNNHK